MIELADEETIETYYPKCPCCFQWQEQEGHTDDCHEVKTQCGSCGQYFYLSAYTSTTYTCTPVKGSTLVGEWEIKEYSDRNLLGITDQKGDA